MVDLLELQHHPPGQGRPVEMKISQALHITPCIICHLKNRPLLPKLLGPKGHPQCVETHSLLLSSLLFSAPFFSIPSAWLPFPHLTYRHQEFTETSKQDPIGTHWSHSEHGSGWGFVLVCACAHMDNSYVWKHRYFFFFPTPPPTSIFMPAGLVKSEGSVNTWSYCISVYLHLPFCLIPFSLCPPSLRSLTLHVPLSQTPPLW